jgi:hypothetical protein
LLDPIQNFLILRESALCKFRKNQFPINTHLEPSAIGGQDDQLSKVLLLQFEDFSRQTDGLDDVASRAAVLNLNLVDHGLTFLSVRFHYWSSMVLITLRAMQTSALRSIP